MKPAEHDLLVLEAQDGSRAALDALVRLHHRSLLRFAWSLAGDMQLAQDAVQDAWLRVASRLRRLEDPRAFRGWLFHAVRWRVFDLLKRADRRGLPLDQAEPQPVSGRDLDGALDLAAAIERLAAPEREAIRLFYEHGFALAEIAMIQNIPPGTVKSRLHRARNQLRQCFEGDEQ